MIKQDGDSSFASQGLASFAFWVVAKTPCCKHLISIYKRKRKKKKKVGGGCRNAQPSSRSQICGSIRRWGDGDVRMTYGSAVILNLDIPQLSYGMANVYQGI